MGTSPRILFLDDDISRVEEFQIRTGLTVVHSTNIGDFISRLNDSRYDLIMLDHDLGTNDGDGSDAAKYLAANRLLLGDDQTVIIHSANPIGAANMMSHMKHADHLRVSVIHFAWNKVSYSGDVLSFGF